MCWGSRCHCRWPCCPSRVSRHYGNPHSWRLSSPAQRAILPFLAASIGRRIRSWETPGPTARARVFPHPMFRLPWGRRQRKDTGRREYPRLPDLRSPTTQNLTDGEIHYIIKNGVQLTGMPAWRSLGPDSEDDIWKLVSFVRSLRPLTPQERTEQSIVLTAAHYVGSQACVKCHQDIYEQ
jgi:hypothetical protein